MEQSQDATPATPAIPLHRLLASAPDAFVVVARDGAIVWANQTAHEVFGYEPPGLAGVLIELLVPERLRERHLANRAEYAAHPRQRPMGVGLQLFARRRDGTELPVEISLSPLAVGEEQLVIAIVRDVTERRVLEDERNALFVQLERERERDRIAMDLHDGLMQDIYAVSLTLELALQETADDATASAATVERGIGQLHEIVRGIRSLVFDLRPRHFSGDLADDLVSLVQEFERNALIETDFEVDATPPLDGTTAIAVHHIAREALSNVQKHAHAAHVRVALAFSPGQGVLSVRDDGRGFDAAKQVSEGHRGLRNMAARAAAIGASLAVESSAGGTCVTVTFPLRPR